MMFPSKALFQPVKACKYNDIEFDNPCFGYIGLNDEVQLSAELARGTTATRIAFD